MSYVVIHYCDKQGAVLIQQYLECPTDHASEQQLQAFARKHLETLNLSQRCAADIKSADVFTKATTWRAV